MSAIWPCCPAMPCCKVWPCSACRQLAARSTPAGPTASAAPVCRLRAHTLHLQCACTPRHSLMQHHSRLQSSCCYRTASGAGPSRHILIPENGPESCPLARDLSGVRPAGPAAPAAPAAMYWPSNKMVGHGTNAALCCFASGTAHEADSTKCRCPQWFPTLPCQFYPQQQQHCFPPAPLHCGLSHRT